MISYSVSAIPSEPQVNSSSFSESDFSIASNRLKDHSRTSTAVSSQLSDVPRGNWPNEIGVNSATEI